MCSYGVEGPGRARTGLPGAVSRSPDGVRQPRSDHMYIGIGTLLLIILLILLLT